MTKLFLSLFFLVVLPVFSPVSGAPIKIPAGRFAPLYGIEKDQVAFDVKSFSIDQFPVTVGEFKKFISSHNEWSREQVSSLYADKNYLKDLSVNPRSAIVSVSWFAANSYCESRKGRLPTTLEWEMVAAASETKKDASKDEAFVNKILEWYSFPEDNKIQKIPGKDKPNFYGLHNLHGLNWEWTSDFNSIIMTNDNREDGSKLNVSFCGAGSIGSKTKEDYAAFVRYSLRSSLEASFTLTNLGFRCAYD
jgi:formylglycine-generating enzyme required for sulfatase activity